MPLGHVCWTRALKLKLLALQVSQLSESPSTFSHTCTIHLAALWLTVSEAADSSMCVCVSEQMCVCLHERQKQQQQPLFWRGLAWLRSSKQSSSSVSCRLKSDCQNKDAERAFKRKRSIPSCVSVELFWGSLAGRVKVYFVFAAGPQHKASGSWLVKCWWRYYKVKSRVYKPAVCMVRAFPAEQWVSELVWQWRGQTQREIAGERTRK